MTPPSGIRLGPFSALLTLALSGWTAAALGAETFSALPREAIVKSQFIADQPPTPSSHASTIVDSRGVVLAAWFGGVRERNPDVSIYLSRYGESGWSAPRQVANGVQADGTRYPCWNPVLFRPREGPLLLFYKVGPSPEGWWGMLMTSENQGATWSSPVRLPPEIIGPVRNKPVELPGGLLLCGSSTEQNGWMIHMEWTRDLGKTWERTKDLNRPPELGVIQPTILAHAPGRIQILCRSQQGNVFQSWSEDQGKSWSPLEATPLPNPNSAIDAVRMANGRCALVYNHTRQGRSPLNIAFSRDGQEWQPPFSLESEPGEYSYPAVIQASNGLLHVTYTWKRQRIKHLILDPEKMLREKAP